jgi:hypothetical protein
MKIPLKEIKIDSWVQPRYQMNINLISEYREAMQAGDVFPNVVVFYDGRDYWMAAGFHRYSAIMGLRGDGAIKDDTIEADVRSGGRRDAFLYAVGTNFDNGERRTPQDMRAIVGKMLADAEWSQLSDSEIARQCKVSHALVSKMRAEISLSTAESDKPKSRRSHSSVAYTPPPKQRQVKTKHGSVTMMDTTNIGRHRKRVSEHEHTWKRGRWCSECKQFEEDGYDTATTH